MSKLQDMLRVQARLHRKQGANALGDLFDNASKEIESLSEQLAKANESALFYKEQYEKTDRECTKLAMREAKANERVEKLTSYIRIIATTPSAPQTICPNEPIDPRKSRDDYISEAWYYLEQLRKGQE